MRPKQTGRSDQRTGQRKKAHIDLMADDQTEESRTDELHDGPHLEASTSQYPIERLRTDSLTGKIFRPIKDLYSALYPLEEIPWWRYVLFGYRLPSIFKPHFPIKAAFKLLAGSSWTSTRDSVQLELTSYCNLKCPNCERSTGQAPSKDFLSLEQIRQFLDESSVAGVDWRSIHLLGGEPTLHPHFLQVLELLKAYKDRDQHHYVVLWTNGYGNRVNSVLSNTPPWVKVINSSKDPKETLRFFSYNVAPIDIPKYQHADFSKGCFVAERCGFILTKYGYYPCGPGAAVDRVFGFDIGIKTLSEVNDRKLKDQMNTLCKYCGFFKATDLFARNKYVTEQEESETWKNAYEKYRLSQAKLSSY